MKPSSTGIKPVIRGRVPATVALLLPFTELSFPDIFKATSKSSAINIITVVTHVLLSEAHLPSGGHVVGRFHLVITS